ncbi:hypothetical protein GCWU000342_02201 [Shuttleworthella satelles DSM 14600]|uniref:Uncharacterized protein n=1 Tax=Shuttleworthella satelles DSM 14600 TaxID=626523 RepID=C4GDM7_9FIRM|nr:hypothetical protein GCWU000342_02201 [Shuttleworthia satelles DSM 14600]
MTGAEAGTTPHSRYQLILHRVCEEDQEVRTRDKPQEEMRRCAYA